jgi:hypothetical protein
MDDADVAVRNATFAAFVELGRPPAADELGNRDDILASWRRLHDAHAIVLAADGCTLRMLSPFSVVPTPHVVHAAGRDWYANCAWDAFGVSAALDTDAEIRSTCPDCGDELHVDIVDKRPSDETLVFHCLVPAQHWWDDIVFT